MSNCIVSFSGGKDSTLALHKIKCMGLKPAVLLFWVHGTSGLTYRHGFDSMSTSAYEAALGIPVVTVPLPEGDDIPVACDVLRSVKKKYNADIYVTGDINNPCARALQETIANTAGLEPCFPLWGRTPLDCTQECIDLGYRCMMKSIAIPQIPTDYLGKDLNQQMVDELLSLGLDPGGEDNSYHTLVYDGPCFLRPLRIFIGNTVSSGDIRMIRTFSVCVTGDGSR